MFLLAQRVPIKYHFGEKPWYASKHLGQDYKAYYEPVFAPFDGKIVNRFWGAQGGNTIYFEGNNIKLRIMHLSKFIAPIGPVNYGQQIGITGNTGLSTGAHLHVDCPNTFVGSFWQNFANFTDPEKIDWNVQKTEVATMGVGTAPKPAGFPKRVTASANVFVRTAPNTNAPLGGNQKLTRGTIITVNGIVDGQSVNGNNKWYVSIKGNYLWSGAFY